MYADHHISWAIAEERYTRRTRRTITERTDTRR